MGQGLKEENRSVILPIVVYTAFFRKSMEMGKEQGRRSSRLNPLKRQEEHYLPGPNFNLF